ncbi:MAG TPA: MBL fold metallo-hydrolase [Ktedonobacteraceae bacterium]|jgi:glyoxylase-like metal-dependent hydrolase (beta-lactamase superfamily II)|nr:MBL fold metallo-hydrolase [Ktedonobacteraceae bacterium]
MTTSWSYTRGLHDLGNSVYAYLQPTGSWGWSNAGIVTDGESALLIDTLYDLKLTQEMLDTMRRSIPAAAHIETVVNTHGDGDHCHGNQLVADALIIASKRAAEQMMKEPPPEILTKMVEHAPQGPEGDFMRETLGAFDFRGITLTMPQKTFEQSLTLFVGDKRVELIEVGPAHTPGDTLVYVPEDRTIFTGDILFIGGHPIVWAGPISNWLHACDRILDLDVVTIVPGHGPITDKNGVREVKSYLEYIYAEARSRYEKGMSAFDAARDIVLTPYNAWINGERIVANVAAAYREFSGVSEPENVHKLFAQMAHVYYGTTTNSSLK